MAKYVVNNALLRKEGIHSVIVLIDFVTPILSGTNCYIGMIRRLLTWLVLQQGREGISL